MASLLPAEFDELVSDAVRIFWATRSGSGQTGQIGNRGAVIRGKNLDGFTALVETVAALCGLPSESVITTGRDQLTLPGFFRPTKRWDVLVMHRGRLLAVFEFKSQVGPSFGNNYNNRTEEALGSAVDLNQAQDRGAFQAMDVDPRESVPPFMGYLMLLEDCPASRSSVSTSSPHYPVLPEFIGASYADRYESLCRKLMAERLYTAAALVLSPAEGGLEAGVSRSASRETSIRYLFERFAGEMTAYVNMIAGA